MSITRSVFVLTAGLWSAMFVTRGLASPPEASAQAPVAMAMAASAAAPQQAPPTAKPGYLGSEACPHCPKGKVYPQKEPSPLLRIPGIDRLQVAPLEHPGAHTHPTSLTPSIHPVKTR